MASCPKPPSADTVARMDTADRKALDRLPDYEAPTLTVLGTLHGLTADQDKTFGPSDGFTFMGVAITNAS
jgi:hypothetical protein